MKAPGWRHAQYNGIVNKGPHAISDVGCVRERGDVDQRTTSREVSELWLHRKGAGAYFGRVDALQLLPPRRVS
jgi:hypothetical protein